MSTLTLGPGSAAPDSPDATGAHPVGSRLPGTTDRTGSRRPRGRGPRRPLWQTALLMAGVLGPLTRRPPMASPPGCRRPKVSRDPEVIPRSQSHPEIPTASR